MSYSTDLPPYFFAKDSHDKALAMIELDKNKTIENLGRYYSELMDERGRLKLKGMNLKNIMNGKNYNSNKGLQLLGLKDTLESRLSELDTQIESTRQYLDEVRKLPPECAPPGYIARIASMRKNTLSSRRTPFSRRKNRKSRRARKTRRNSK